MQFICTPLSDLQYFKTLPITEFIVLVVQLCDVDEEFYIWKEKTRGLKKHVVSTRGSQKTTWFSKTTSPLSMWFETCFALELVIWKKSHVWLSFASTRGFNTTTCGSFYSSTRGFTQTTCCSLLYLCRWRSSSWMGRPNDMWLRA